MLLPDSPSVSQALSRLREDLRHRGSRNLLTKDMGDLVPAGLLREDRDSCTAYIARHGVRVEQRDFPYQCIPYVLTSEAYARLTEDFRRLFPVLERVIELYLTRPEVRDFFQLAPKHERLVRMGAHYRPRIQYCRYDFTLGAGQQPQIYELNTHCPATAVFSYHFSQMFAHSGYMARLRDLGLRPAPTPLEQPGAFAQAMLASARRNGLSAPRPHVAVLNSRYLTMSTELEHIAAQFREQGCEVVRCFVEDLRFDGQHLLAGDLPIHVAYNKYDDSRGPDEYECAFSRTTQEVQAYIDAYAAGAVLGINSFPGMFLTEQKSTLAFLWSPLARRLLGQEELGLVERLVPRTLLLRHLEPEQRESILRHREAWVLKRSLDTRGRGVLLGRSVSEEQWRSALAEALVEPGGNHVLQAVALPEQCETLLGSQPGPERAFTSLACFLFAGEPVGLIVRTSEEETTNVARRGFIQPALVLEGEI
jgi:uncharacterized circularly permuted ATP-grasp superfamily protein